LGEEERAVAKDEAELNRQTAIDKSLEAIALTDLNAEKRVELK
jgi:hypothetical protein